MTNYEFLELPLIKKMNSEIECICKRYFNYFDLIVLI